MRITILALLTILFSVVLLGCSSGPKIEKSAVLAEVAGEKIFLEDIIDNPTFSMLLENFITEKIILQEFEARHLVLSDEKFTKEWDKFVLSRAQGDETKLRLDLQQQGITLDYMKNQIRNQVKFMQILEDEFPVNLEHLLICQVQFKYLR